MKKMLQENPEYTMMRHTCDMDRLATIVQPACGCSMASSMFSHHLQTLNCLHSMQPNLEKPIYHMTSRLGVR